MHYLGNFRNAYLVFLTIIALSLLVIVMFLPNVKYINSDYKFSWSGNSHQGSSWTLQTCFEMDVG